MNCVLLLCHFKGCDSLLDLSKLCLQLFELQIKENSVNIKIIKIYNNSHFVPQNMIGFLLKK